MASAAPTSSSTSSLEKNDGGIVVHNADSNEIVSYVDQMLPWNRSDILTSLLLTTMKPKKILRKIDWRLLPVLTLLYLLAFLDRSNIGNAKVAGMNKDLKLTGTQYNLALTVSFLTYASLEVPSNIILKMFKRPSHFITILMLGWGAVMCCMGVVKNYHQLLVTRIFLGVFEAGGTYVDWRKVFLAWGHRPLYFFQFNSFLLTVWYVRWEVQTRLAIFFTMACMAGAFSGLLAFALAKMDGIGGYAGWRWIFLMEGIVTVAVALIVPWILPDSPELAGWLNASEKGFINARLVRDSGTEQGRVHTHDGCTWESIRTALFDWRIWFCCLIYNGGSVTIYSFMYTVPSIIVELGYTASKAQLMTIPLYFCGAVSTVAFARWSDKKRSRWPSIVIPYTIALLGFIGLISVPHPKLPGLTYGLLFLIPTGVYPPIVALISWVSNNLSPTWVRAVGMAVLVTGGNFGGAIGSNIFPQQQKPRYWLGYGFSIAILTTANVLTFVLRWIYLRTNKQRDAMDVNEVRARYTEEELRDMGDKSPLYRYVFVLRKSRR